MTTRFLRFLSMNLPLAAIAIGVAACGAPGETGTGSGAGGAGSGATSGAQTGTSSGSQASSSGAGMGGAASASSSGAGMSSSSAGSSSSGGPMGLATLGSLVVLGDSISDGGGVPPFYYDLLKADLIKKYGNITYQNKAQSGSTTGALVSQINSLPKVLPGPVAVTITSGGNDMKAALLQVILGQDGPAKMQMDANIKAALDALLTPGRFGPGVQVYVFEGNIYDASDGAGDFGSHNCAFGKGVPTIPSDPFFNAWNAVILNEVQAHGQVQADMHTYFYGHGYKSVPDWYANDCTHPSQVGHNELHKLFYLKITGIALP